MEQGYLTNAITGHINDYMMGFRTLQETAGYILGAITDVYGHEKLTPEGYKHWKALMDIEFQLNDAFTNGLSNDRKIGYLYQYLGYCTYHEL